MTYLKKKMPKEQSSPQSMDLQNTKPTCKILPHMLCSWKMYASGKTILSMYKPLWRTVKLVKVSKL